MLRKVLILLIDLPSESSTVSESVPPVESSDASSVVVSYPDPVFPGGQLETPVNPEDEALVGGIVKCINDALMK